jgi:alcohol dehydrogenase class IV
VVARGGAADAVRRELGRCGVSRPLLVGRDRVGLGFPVFDGFGPNPKYEEAVAGVAAFRAAGCDSVVSVGGGSAMDVAKCVKLWAGLDPGETPYHAREVGYAPIPHIAVPTTAGTGAEATRFAVIYVDGHKHSVEHECALPDAAVLDAALLATLPEYQRKATALDALGQCVESVWARGATPQSREWADAGIALWLANWRAYVGAVGGAEAAAEAMLGAANLSGKAINLTRTTAAHALSYRVTTLFGAAHGHAVGLLLGPVWERLAGDPESASALAELNRVFGGNALAIYKDIYTEMNLPTPGPPTPEQLDDLAASVNPQRLANHPHPLTATDIRAIYEEVLRA